MAKETKNDNLRFYEALRGVPAHALKAIQAGRLSGKSDINPVWRIKAITEAFGPCGIGWKYEITKQWQETYGVEVKSFTNINLYIKVDGQWSDPIPGTGGATLVENSRNGIYVNDEGHKMSLTDALSVAMKALGVAADVYFSKDKDVSYETKYEQQALAAMQSQTQGKTKKQAQQPAPAPAPAPVANEAELQEAFELIKANIESAPSKQYLKDLHAQNTSLHDYPAYREAMNKRFKEVPA